MKYYNKYIKYKRKYTTLQQLIGGDDTIILKEVKSLNDDERNTMYKMYAKTYTDAGQNLWFQTSEELFERYPCFVTFSGENKHLIVYAMFQKKESVNKISLICHNSTDEGKANIMELISNLVKKPGWIIEAAGGVSWLLRSRWNAPIIQSDQIKVLLEIKETNVNDKIIINNTFDITDKKSYQYTREFTDIDTNITYSSNETLFGTKPCYYENNHCNRICPEI
jgi:hypothetical protein